MVGWIILGIIVGILALILLIPVGVDLRYEDEVVRLSAMAAGIRLQLLPRQKKPPKEETGEEKKKEEPKEEKPRKERSRRRKPLSFNAEEILELLRVVLRGFGRFGRKFKIDRFVLHWIAPRWDPYTSARIFAVVNSAMSQLAPICEERFHCKDSSVWTDIDFTREDMFLEFGLTFTIRIGQILGTGLSIAFGALKILLRSRRRTEREAKEEAAALEAWLKEHPEEAAALQRAEGADSTEDADNPTQQAAS